MYEDLLAYCGLICHGCPLYWASQEKSKEKKDKMRLEIARICKAHYGIEVKQDEITDCDGCRTEGGRLFSGSRQCEIRKCARQKGVENCAHCDEYACEILQALFSTDPSAKTRLDVVRSTL